MAGSGLHKSSWSTVPKAARMSVDPFALTETNGVRRFSDSKLDEAINAAIARKNPDKDLVVVGHIDRNKLYFSALYKMGDNFSVVAAAYKSRSAPDWDVGAEVIWTPF